MGAGIQAVCNCNSNPTDKKENEFNINANIDNNANTVNIGDIQDNIYNTTNLNRNDNSQNALKLEKENLDIIEQSKLDNEQKLSKIIINYENKVRYLINRSQGDSILKWINLKKHENLKLNLVFKGSIHGFSSTNFHSRCDGQAPTVIVVLNENGKLFGGYSKKSWHSTEDIENILDSSKTSFLFSLNTGRKYKMLGGYGITNHKYWGPHFGNDLIICENCNNMKKSWSSLGNNYEGYREDEQFIGSKAGQEFLVNDYEVYHVQGIEIPSIK